MGQAVVGIELLDLGLLDVELFAEQRLILGFEIEQGLGFVTLGLDHLAVRIKLAVVVEHEKLGVRADHLPLANGDLSDRGTGHACDRDQPPLGLDPAEGVDPLGRDLEIDVGAAVRGNHRLRLPGAGCLAQDSRENQPPHDPLGGARDHHTRHAVVCRIRGVDNVRGSSTQGCHDAVFSVVDRLGNVGHPASINCGGRPPPRGARGGPIASGARLCPIRLFCGEPSHLHSSMVLDRGRECPCPWRYF